MHPFLDCPHRYHHIEEDSAGHLLLKHVDHGVEVVRLHEAEDLLLKQIDCLGVLLVGADHHDGEEGLIPPRNGSRTVGTKLSVERAWKYD